MDYRDNSIKHSTSKRLIPYLRPYQWHVAAGIFLAVVLSLANGATAWVVKPLLDEVFGKKDLQLLRLFPFIILAIFFVKGITRFAQAYLIRSLGQKIVNRIREELYRHLLKMPLGYFKTMPYAELISRMTNDINILSDISSQVISKFFQHFFTMLALLAVIFYQEWKLALLYFLLTATVIFPLSIIGKKLRLISHGRQTSLGDLSKLIQEAFYDLKIIKMLAIEGYVSKRFLEENHKLLAINQRGIVMEELFTPILEIVGAVGLALVVYLGGMSVLEGTSTPGELFSFMTAVGMLFMPIRKISKMHGVLQKSLAAADRVWGILDQKPEENEQKELIDFKGLQNLLEMKNVSFSYDGEKPVLESVNLSIKAGESVTLIGYIGSGKTSLSNLITKVYNVSDGVILLDGVDISRYSVKSLRKRIGVVNQKVVIFNDTIKNNIALKQAGSNDPWVIEAAKKANIHDFILTLPDQYETILDKHANLLSKGENILLNIARAFYKSPDILIIDEADSPLGHEFDQLIFSALKDLIQGRTSLVIASRTDTAKLCHRIAILDKGKLIAQGTHEELLEKLDLYRRIIGFPNFERRKHNQ